MPCDNVVWSSTCSLKLKSLWRSGSVQIFDFYVHYRCYRRPLLSFYLVLFVVDLLYHTGDGRLHQHQDGELPGETHHQEDHPQGLDGRPQQDVEVQRHCPPHHCRVFGQPGGDFTYTEQTLHKLEMDFCLILSCPALCHFSSGWHQPGCDAT